MPGAEYDTTGPSGLRKLLGSSGFRFIGTGFQALGKDLERQMLGFSAHAANVVAVAGELLKMTATATVTLPAATNNAVIGVFCAAGETTIKTPAGVKIFGDFINGAETIKLAVNQHVILQSDGTNWFIVAGEPKREEACGALVARARSTGAGINEFTPNATRPTLVVASFSAASGKQLRGIVIVKNAGGAEVTVASAEGISATSALSIPVSFEVPAGATWRWTGVVETSCESSYLAR